jgi:hypothetical protein
MSNSVGNDASRVSGADQAEVTLRLIAGLPAPQGLEDRIHAAVLTARPRARVFEWPVSRPWQTGWLRGAAAAAIVCMVAGGGWGIYSHVQPGQTAPSVQLHGTSGGHFGTIGAVRRPQTLDGPTVTQAIPVKAPQPATAAKLATKAATSHKHAQPEAAISKTTALPVASAVPQ